ncbi:hypothetical protein [uncultured Sphingomonas sp.]|uniref:hypothetical protein n=1 Tax=uncultured Sphingomonas sp. TaxID=158754 RepID=UPI0035CB2D59
MTTPPERYDYLKWHANARRRRPRHRDTRWTLTVVLAAMLTFVIVATILNDPTRPFFPPFLIIPMPMIVATNRSPFARDTWLTERGLQQYDEFERAALGRATTRAYLSLVLGLTAVLLLAALALDVGERITITPGLFLIWATAVPVLAFTLPVLIAEWTVPMPDAEDQQP